MANLISVLIVIGIVGDVKFGRMWYLL